MVLSKGPSLSGILEYPILRKLPILQARRCCGLDAHKETVVAHVQAPDGTQGPGVRKSYGTMQVQLIALRTWLKQMKVTHIAMESTGDLFNHGAQNGVGRGARPTFALLDADLERARRSSVYLAPG